MTPPGTSLDGLLSSIVLRELQKLNEASKMEFCLSEAQLEALVQLAKILKQSPDLATQEAPLFATVANIEDALKLIGSPPEEK